MNGQTTRMLLLGVAIGSSVGIATGMLYAPHSGRITRGLFNEKVSEARHEAERIVDDARGRAKHIMKDAKSRIGKS